MSIVILFEFALLVSLSLIFLYQAAFVLASFFCKKQNSPKLSASVHRLAVLIPAHNEELLIDRCLRSITSADYPEVLRDIYVIADNCSDRTVDKAVSHPIICLKRDDLVNPGKGYAIRWALERINLHAYDAVLFVDADAVASPNIFVEIDQLLCRGEKAIQVYNGTLNAGQSWLTRCARLSDVLQFELYFKGREVVGATSRLLGNGMCLHKEVLEKVPWTAYSITENWEYYFDVLRAGYRVAFTPVASANTDQVVSLREGKTQKTRWQVGWLETVKRYLRGAINTAWRRREWRLADAVVDFLLPSPSTQALLLGLALIGVLVVDHRFVQWWTLVIVMIAGAIYSVCLVVSGAGCKDCAALLYAPAYIGWKVLVRICVLISGPPRSWVRTKRKESEAL